MEDKQYLIVKRKIICGRMKYKYLDLFVVHIDYDVFGNNTNLK